MGGRRGWYAARLGQATPDTEPMNESMTSISDHSFDPDDNFSRISPELVLVDPEARAAARAREPEPVAACRVPLMHCGCAALGVVPAGGVGATGLREAPGDRGPPARRCRPGTGSPRAGARAVPGDRPLALRPPVRPRRPPPRVRSRRRRRGLPGPDASRRSRRQLRPRRRLRLMATRAAHVATAPVALLRGRGDPGVPLALPWWRRPPYRGRRRRPTRRCSAWRQS